MMKKTALFALITGAMLAGCGGGGSVSVATTAPQVTVTTLATSNGDLSKYLGNWRSDCGISASNLLNSSTDAKYQINFFEFSAVNGNAITGKLTIRYYSDILCSHQASGSSIDIPTPITLTYQKSITVTSDSPATMAGSADQFLMSVTGSSATQPYTAGFYSNFSKFVQGTDSKFTSYSLSYSKIN